MSETAVEYKVLQTSRNPDTIDAGPPDTIVVSRQVLEQEHNQLIARIHLLRKLLGFPPLMTGKQQRRAHE